MDRNCRLLFPRPLQDVREPEDICHSAKYTIFLSMAYKLWADK